MAEMHRTKYEERDSELSCPLLMDHSPSTCMITTPEALQIPSVRVFNICYCCYC